MRKKKSDSAPTESRPNDLLNQNLPQDGGPVKAVGNQILIRFRILAADTRGDTGDAGWPWGAIHWVARHVGRALWSGGSGSGGLFDEEPLTITPEDRAKIVDAARQFGTDRQRFLEFLSSLSEPPGLFSDPNAPRTEISPAQRAEIVDAAEALEPEALGEYLDRLCAGSSGGGPGNMLPRGATANKLAATPAPPIDWVLPGAIPAGQLAMLAGADGTGKSYLALQMAISVATGIPWAGGLLPAPEKMGPVVYVSGEDDLDEAHRRIRAILAAYDRLGHGDRVWMEGLGRLEIIPMDGQKRPLMTADSRQSASTDETLWAKALAARVKGARLFILDPLIMFHGLSENDNGQLDDLARLIIQTAKRAGACAGLVVHHAGQSSVREGADDHMVARGGTAFGAAARAVFTIRWPDRGQEKDLKARGLDPTDFRLVRGPKVSRARRRDPAWVRVDGSGVPMMVPDPLVGAGEQGSVSEAPPPKPGRQVIPLFNPDPPRMV